MNETRKKVIRHYHVLARIKPEYCPTRMAELAPGVVAVEDQSGECDVMFEKRLWRFTTPNLWRQARGSKSPMLHKTGLKVLQGVGRAPQVSIIEDMVDFAKRHLSPKGSHTWRDAPLYFTF